MSIIALRRVSQSVSLSLSLSLSLLHASALREKLTPWLLACFLALGPVHWLPGIPHGVVRAVEWLLVLSALVLVFSGELAARRLPFPRGLLGPVGFAGLAFLWIPGLLSAASASDTVDFLVALASSALLFWCFWCMAAANETAIWTVFRRSFVIIGALGGAALLNEMTGSVLWSPGDRWHRAFAFSGFGVRSTAWSIGLALFLPLAVLLYGAAGKPTPGSNRRRSVTMRCISVGSAVAMLGSQCVGGGRLGFLAGLAVAATLVMVPSSRRLGVVVCAVLGLFIMANAFGRDQYCGFADSYVAERSGPADLSAGEGSDAVSQGSDAVSQGSGIDWEDPAEAVAGLDIYSAHRLAGYRLGIEGFAEDPLLGHGLDRFRLLNPAGESVELHGLWLKWLVEAGPLAPLWLLAMTICILRAGYRACRDPQSSETERRRSTGLMVVVLAGLLMSVFEVALQGAQTAAVWWAAGGALTGCAARRGLVDSESSRLRVP